MAACYNAAMLSQGTLRNRLFRRLLPALGGCLVVLAMVPATAAALTVTARASVVETVDVGVRLDAGDRGGLAMLFLDGAVVDSTVVTPSVAACFRAVPLAVGSHDVRVALRSAAGITMSSGVTVRAWGKPAMPAVTGLHAGIYQVTTPLTVTAGSATTQLTAIVAGKTVWTKAVSAGTKLATTLTLPAGADVVEFLAGNPCGATTSAKVTLQCAVWPCPSYTYVGSEFGPRDGRMHKGIDIHADFGAPVVSIAPGRVIWAEPLTSYGGLVLVDHGGHIVSYYAHLQRIDVKLGQLVKAGQRIATVGNTGNASGGSPHLHFQVYTGALGWSDTPDKFRRVNSGIWTNPRLWIGPNP
jgi:murein DD-endopeptidase MepM/ murein hydrolase activator NlpD